MGTQQPSVFCHLVLRCRPAFFATLMFDVLPDIYIHTLSLSLCELKALNCTLVNMIPEQPFWICGTIVGMVFVISCELWLNQSCSYDSQNWNIGKPQLPNTCRTVLLVCITEDFIVQDSTGILTGSYLNDVDI